MIGTPVECSIWLVDFRHENPDPKKEPPFVHATNVLIVTADPSGADVYEVLERVVKQTTAQGRSATGLVIERVTRQASNVRGLANLTARSELHDGGLALAMTELEVVHLRAELESAQRLLQVQAAELRRLHAERGELPELATPEPVVHACPLEPSGEQG